LESSLDLAALRAFIASHIENYEQLEVLLLLNRRRQSVSAAAVAAELKLEESEVGQALRALESRHLLADDDAGLGKMFRFSPKTAELLQGVELLARAYDEHRIKLIQLMNANALERAKMIALRKFAEGFRLGGSKKDG